MSSKIIISFISLDQSCRVVLVVIISPASKTFCWWLFLCSFDSFLVSCCYPSLYSLLTFVLLNLFLLSNIFVSIQLFSFICWCFRLGREKCLPSWWLFSLRLSFFLKQKQRVEVVVDVITVIIIACYFIRIRILLDPIFSDCTCFMFLPFWGFSLSRLIPCCVPL